VGDKKTAMFPQSKRSIRPVFIAKPQRLTSAASALMDPTSTDVNGNTRRKLIKVTQRKGLTS
jgi:hypothetical protein